MLWWRGWRINAAQQARLQQRLARVYTSLSQRPLSYAEPGMTQRTDSPRGFRRTLLRQRIGNGEATFRQAHEALATGQMHRSAGLGLFPLDLRLSNGAEFVSYITVGPLAIVSPCRVVAVLDEPLRAGVTYGTLPGHPLCGEEEFSIELESGGTVWLNVHAISKPGTFYARLGAPFIWRAQSNYAHRYAVALRSSAGTRAPS
ncbi:MAG: DUF1990 family protein [Mycobacteriales bacterium]